MHAFNPTVKTNDYITFPVRHLMINQRRHASLRSEK